MGKLNLSVYNICIIYIGIEQLPTISVSSPIFFKHIEIVRPLELYSYSDSRLNITCKFKLIAKICEFFLQRLFLKMYLKKWPPLS